MDISENDKKNTIKSWPVYLFLLLVLASSLWAIHKRRQGRPVEAIPEVISEGGNEEAVSTPLLAPNEVKTMVSEPEKADAVIETTKQEAIQSIVNSRQGWDAVGANWYGKEVEDFSFRSISDEKMRKLSDYRGKDVIVVFWATWCPPCKMEIPHLKKLREEISSEKLEIIAISKENTDILKRFTKANNLNYTVTSISSRLPAPFSLVESIPTSFYINEQGKIDLIIIGVVPEKAAKSIILLPEK